MLIENIPLNLPSKGEFARSFAIGNTSETASIEALPEELYRKNVHKLTFPLLVDREEKKESVFCFESEELHPSAVSLNDRDR